MTDEQQKLSDRFLQAHLLLQALGDRFLQAYLFLQACVATADNKDESLLGQKPLNEMCEALLKINNEWRTYSKDPISLDPKLFAIELLHRLADQIERGELVL